MSFLRGYARKLGVTEYLGTWNASTNTPSLVSSTGQRGGYYIVSVPGTTSLDGVSDWQVNDWVIFNGSVWQKIDNSELVTSVAGKTGSVTLVSNDITDFTEASQDAVGSALTNSTNINFTYPDAQNQISADLTDTSVIPGTYNTVTVDAKGRVTSASINRYTYKTATATAVTVVTYTSVAQLTTISLPIGLYKFSFAGQMQSAANGTGVGVRIAGVSATITPAYAQWRIKQAADGVNSIFEYDQLTATTNVTSASVQAANTNFNVIGDGVFRVTVEGTVAIQTRSELANNAVTLQPNSILVVELV